jgi:hypothetical protein
MMVLLGSLSHRRKDRVMRFQLAAAIAAVTVGIAAAITPLDAKSAVSHASSGKRSANIAHAARAPAQPASPPIGYCMECLPPPYAWPHGGAGP